MGLRTSHEGFERVSLRDGRKPGGVRAALDADRGSDRASSRGVSFRESDPERRSLEVGRVQGIHSEQHRRFREGFE